MYSNRLYTPLRYPGGKGQFANFVARIVEENDLRGGHYLEPYAGGAAVALSLLFEGYVSKIHINDFDPAIYAFWVAATTQTEELIKLITKTEINIDNWHYWRGIFLSGNQEISILEKGFSTLFLNRTNRSGILKAGVIGGLHQNGTYKIDARFKKDVIIKRLEKIGENSEKIIVHCEDAHDLLINCNKFLPEKSLIYLDPPYFIKGKGLYRNFYKKEDHKKISNLLKNKVFNQNWIVSYDNVDEIIEMYSFTKSFSYELNYSAQKIYVGNEVMFFKDGLKIPFESVPKSKLIA